MKNKPRLTLGERYMLIKGNENVPCTFDRSPTTNRLGLRSKNCFISLGLLMFMGWRIENVQSS